MRIVSDSGRSDVECWVCDGDMVMREAAVLVKGARWEKADRSEEWLSKGIRELASTPKCLLAGGNILQSLLVWRRQCFTACIQCCVVDFYVTARQANSIRESASWQRDYIRRTFHEWRDPVQPSPLPNKAKPSLLFREHTAL